MTNILLFAALVLGVFTMAASGASPPYTSGDGCGVTAACLIGP
jgi:hypothetical protein